MPKGYGHIRSGVDINEDDFYKFYNSMADKTYKLEMEIPIYIAAYNKFKILFDKLVETNVVDDELIIGIRDFSIALENYSDCLDPCIATKNAYTNRDTGQSLLNMAKSGIDYEERLKELKERQHKEQQQLQKKIKNKCCIM